MRTWESFEGEVDQLTKEFHTHWMLWWDECGYRKPPVREDLERELREQGSFLKKSAEQCPHGKTSLTCNTCYFSTGGFSS